MQQIQMVSVCCDYVNHQGQNIGYLCLNPDCKEEIAVCLKCLMKGHQQCKGKMKEFDAISKELMDFQLLYNNLAELQNKINKKFLELLSKIQLLIKPIAQYQETPNLTNLKQIGSLLRTTTKYTISKDTDSTLKTMRQMLDNYGFQNNGREMEVIKNQNSQNSRNFGPIQEQQLQFISKKWQTIGQSQPQYTQQGYRPFQIIEQQQSNFQGFPRNSQNEF